MYEDKFALLSEFDMNIVYQNVKIKKLLFISRENPTIQKATE